MVVGALIGAAAGGLTGKAFAADQETEAQHDKQLDEDIGVTAGDLGAADPNAPPAKRGTYSGASAGAGSADTLDTTEDDGPIPHAD